MQDQYPVEPFERAASSYDHMVARGEGYPYDRYDAVLDEVVCAAAVQRGMEVLDLGTGTGNLAARFHKAGCVVWGVDFSDRMLAEASKKLPGITLVKADLLGEWAGINRGFERVVSSYAFHHFDLRTKVGLLQRIVHDYLAENGRIVIADVSFLSGGDLAEARDRFRQRWEDDEYYWTADETIPRLAEVGLRCHYNQVSICGGVFTITVPQPAAGADPAGRRGPAQP